MVKITFTYKQTNTVIHTHIAADIYEADRVMQTVAALAGYRLGAIAIKRETAAPTAKTENGGPNDRRI